MTIVHLLRHGEVHNPEGVLYGRRPGFHLSERGKAMAQRVADTIGDRDIVHLRISPLERVRETAAPLAAARGLEPVVDERVIESENCFEGRTFSNGPLTLLDPRTWRYLYNPFRPSWGEPYKQVSARMRAAVLDARAEALKSGPDSEAVVVSHQLPIWVTRLSAEGRPFLHDPRKRQCSLCSLTSLHFDGPVERPRLVKVTYSEPAGDMLPRAEASAPFSAGGAPDEKKPT
ncbi:histidine phosphatase family protein [Nocardioides bigeumensis]|uniref:Histidine phosphatase family protein n=1 Tax=Nocardioides bigeumensis TaxID=433657 RepID=A0ABN2YRS4_9ACTN